MWGQSWFEATTCQSKSYTKALASRLSRTLDIKGCVITWQFQEAFGMPYAQAFDLAAIDLSLNVCVLLHEDKGSSTIL
ncbi:hypothetical protein SRHO_G00146490 [Serrasalmus rhombeus]